MIFELLSEPTIDNVGTRVFPQVIPINHRDKYNDNECAVVYQIIDNKPNNDKFAASKVDNVRVQIVAYGNKYSVCETVMATIRARIDYKRAFTLDSTTVQSVSFLDQRDQFNTSGEVVGMSHDYIFRIER